MEDGKEIPYDIVFDILSRLPVQSLLRFRSVCKSWNALISNNSQFINSQLQRSTESNSGQNLIIFHCSSKFFDSIDIEISADSCKKLDPPPFRNRYPRFDVVCSNYGLILLRVFTEPFSSPCINTFILWNPTIRKYKVFECYYTLGSNPGFGICYDSLIDSYKVVFVCQCSGASGLFDVKNESWSSVDKPLSTNLYKSQGVFANGMLHWVLVRRVNFITILCFDVMEAEFKELLHPVEYDNGQLYEIGLAVWRGQLCVYNCYTNSKGVKIWVMEEYGKKESWTNLMVIPNTENVIYLKVLSFTEKGEVVLELDKRELVIYNPSETTFRTAGRSNCINGWTVVTHLESLVLLNSIKTKREQTKHPRRSNKKKGH